MREYYLSKKEMKPLIEQINKNWPEITINKLKNVRATDLKRGRFIITEKFKVIIINGTTIPFIKNNITENFPFIEVDINSIKFITNGANIMRPGITSFSHRFKKNAIILVKDQKYKKILAVGIALEDSDDAEKMNSGIIIKNLHYVGDEFWNLEKQGD